MITDKSIHRSHKNFPVGFSGICSHDVSCNISPKVLIFEQLLQVNYNRPFPTFFKDLPQCIHFDVINVVMYLFLCNICISYLPLLNLINSVPVNVYNAHVYAN